MTVELQIQNACSVADLPTDEAFERWVGAALQNLDNAILTIRLVDAEESREMNSRFRNKDKPTNVLSFPADLPAEVNLPLLGDIVICAPLVAQEAQEQGKSTEAHWAHLSIHGVFHLLGYDHQDEDEAREMESLETQILDTLGFSDPYG